MISSLTTSGTRREGEACFAPTRPLCRGRACPTLPRRGTNLPVTPLVCEGYKDVADADLSKYFDTVPHCELMQCVAQRIVDRDVLRLIKMWLTAPVEERDENGKRRLTGGKDRHCGTPQGGVASPMLANLYMNRLLKGWKNTKRGERFQAQIVNYADDFVILSRGKAKEALEWTRQVVTRLELTLNEAKTSIRQARKESFNFPGYTFGPHRNRKTGHRYLGASPSKSVARIKEKVGGLLAPSNVGPWAEVRDRLNRMLRGWSACEGNQRGQQQGTVGGNPQDGLLRHCLHVPHLRLSHS